MSERTLGEWLSYLEQLHPVDIELGLGRVRTVAQRLNLLPYTPDVITVAGTNGKGSVVYSTEAMLRAHGKRTGLYTSPHILSYNERIAVDGIPVEDDLILAAFNAIEATRGEVSLTYFEFATLAALWVFNEQRVDVAILEVGLGGRLDAVNIVDADFAVITAIDLDHQHWLGNSVEEIAPEKAAVARSKRPVVLAELDYPATLFDTLKDIAADVLRAGQQWLWGFHDGQLLVQTDPKATATAFVVPAGLRPSNVAAAIQVSVSMLGGDFSAEHANRALENLVVPARRQTIEVAGRELMLDVAHNPAAMEALVDYLAAHPVQGTTIAALGLMADKDVHSMAASLALGVEGACALAIPGIDRAAAPEKIWQILDDAGIAIPQSEFTAEAVWEQWLKASSPGDRLLVCGSFHSVAGIMSALNIELPSPPLRVLKTGG
ncbi:bifunctional folylpolyglutamate synthase/dihydrofolate synthase [Congregibacter sp.]|uniref:bifunctional folylpolyglutamate synthase/dihydrofolate synthase n=1 Tax=Congregibacter sp. TaxID=2744308 RepID=UPI003F6C39A1